MINTVNHHLNLFRYFHESHEAHFIENNLSRAFAICLQQDLLFFSEYMREIVVKEDYYYLFSHYEKDSRYIVDLQLDTSAVELSGVKKIYAIAMTGDEHLNMLDFMELKPDSLKDKNITDIWILIKDMVFVIEVKRTHENCKQQLFNQIHPLIVNNPDIIVQPVNLSWPHTLRIMERVDNMRQMREDNAAFIPDFLSLCERRYPEWFPSKPFYQLPPLAAHTSKTVNARDKRLRQIIQQSGEQILGYNDRMAISCKFHWASEIIPYFRTHKKVDYLTFMIWPGNTKGQGYSVYNKSLDWTKKDRLQVGNDTFEVDTEYQLKFCHFNKYITSIDYSDADLITPTHTPNNFYHKSGKWNIDRWPEFEQLMDSHFKPEFNWREKSNWEKHFPDTDRSYFTVSFGFATELWIPYTHFQELDKLPGDFTVPAKFIKDIKAAYRHLLD
jgi:hypothetical protein